MYKKIEDSGIMHVNDAAVLYPDVYLIVQFEGKYSDMCEILYVGDSYKELWTLMPTLENRSYCTVIEGQKISCMMGDFIIE